MKVPLLDLQAQYRTIKDAVHAAVEEVLESQRFIMGNQVASLEKEIAAFCNVPFAIGVASGTDALLVSLKALGVGAGDAVVTVPYTFFATAGAVSNLGARPLFVDIEPRGYALDPEKLDSFLAKECSVQQSDRKLIHKASGSAVKAVLPVHLFGQCADMEEISGIARRYGLPIIEDACQALGAVYKGKAAGSIGDFGCFSFFPSKNLGGAGDGGMILTSSEKLADRARMLRIHGERDRYYHSVVGFNSRLDEIQAAVLRVKLPHLPEWSEARGRNAEFYTRGIEAAGLSDFATAPTLLPDRTHIFHQYVIRCERRDELQGFLKDREIDTKVYYPVSLHEQDCFLSLGYGRNDFPHSHAASKETLALPVYPELTPEQKQHVVDSIAAFYGNA
ncbi:MAG: DegT/DnrJ/EryC1/StrS family aminotransferase [Acidobacteria bacterium]|nr:DegT/DnrJ/EryC1/StrS family aminotransferase [Acidobacteriota bacterium]